MAGLGGIAARRLPANSIEDLKHHTLIHPRYTHMDWDAVAQAAGVERIERKGDLMLDFDLAAMRAAEQGLGVAIFIQPLSRLWLDAGRVVAMTPPTDIPLKNYFVFRLHSGKRAHLMHAYDWIKARFDAPA